MDDTTIPSRNSAALKRVVHPRIAQRNRSVFLSRVALTRTASCEAEQHDEVDSHHCCVGIKRRMADVSPNADPTQPKAVPLDVSSCRGIHQHEKRLDEGNIDGTASPGKQHERQQPKKQKASNGRTVGIIPKQFFAR